MSSHTSGQLKSAVAGFMHRDPSVFVRPAIGSVTGYLTDDQGNRILGSDGNPIVITLPGVASFDILLQAMNNARLYAERRVDFELAVTQVHIPGLNLNDGGSLSNAVLASDDSTPVKIKKIRTPYLPLHHPGHYFPVDLTSKKKWDDRIKARWEGAHPNDRADFAYLTDSPFELVQSGNTVFVAPPNARMYQAGALTIAADVLAWLPDYVDGTEEDFVLDFCFDWLMYRTIQELNFFLKEDERVQLSTKMVQEAWDALVIWNNELQASSVDDVNLD